MHTSSFSIIGSLGDRHRKRVATALFLLLYGELSLPAMGRVLSGEQPAVNYSLPAPVHSVRWEKGSGPSMLQHPVSKIPDAVSDIPSATATNPDEYAKMAIDAIDKVAIDGPGQPEMSSFKSVGSDNMVDLFSGDFSYNIPLMDVGGYPVNIHYNSGISMDQEASWVGLGWNINPGTIGRSMRGLPDDFNGKDSIARTQSIKMNKTTGVTLAGDLEIVGNPIGVGMQTGIFHNSYNGWGIEYGMNASINLAITNKGDKTADGATTKAKDTVGRFSGGLGVNNNSQTGATVSPSLSVTLQRNNTAFQRGASLGISTNYNTRSGITALQFGVSVSAGYRWQKEKTTERSTGVKGLAGSYPLGPAISYAVPTYTPSITMPITNTQFAFSGKLGAAFGVKHPSLAVTGYVSKQEIKPADQRRVLPAYGYLYYTEANNKPDALLDYNHEKELQFNYQTTPHIAIPQYTYDAYSISGEGTGGSFRPHRSDVGYMRDHFARTKSQSDKVSVDLGIAPGFHIGTDYMYSDGFTQNSSWEQENDMNKYIGFRVSDTSYQSVYFRNTGETTSNSQEYYHSIGDDALVRVKLEGNKRNVRAANKLVTYQGVRKDEEITLQESLVKKQRDKRSQVIQYLTAIEARQYGLDTLIASYKENSIPLHCTDTVTYIPRVDATVRKAHHLSEIRVTNGNGQRYVYGIPVYNIDQRDATFAVNKEVNSTNINKGLVEYDANVDNSVYNNKGKDNYFSQDSIPAYAHSFLLSGILSNDYVDIRGDGITEDDPGDAVKFNYTRVFGNNGNHYAWRIPYDSNKANYNEGFKTYNRDDKGSYSFGKKEIWYLNSVESKTMIAVFKVVADRQDAFAAAGVNGGFDKSKGLRRLDRIELYTKADLVKNGTAARPIKTVHFAYSYDLCKGFAGDANKGKLTLDSIWFTYNGNQKGKLNPYVFRYSPGNDGKPQTAHNPAYNAHQNDRWGNYKDAANNPSSSNGGMTNAEYPYVYQDSTASARNASAWNLTDIRLPSGGRMRVTYESDDYGFVQNRRAATLMPLAGFSASVASTTAQPVLYQMNNSDDLSYVIIPTTRLVTSKQQLYNLYLRGIDKLFFKVAVQMPTDEWGGGYEWITGYADIEDYGVFASNSSRFWIKLKKVNGLNPILRSAIEYLRNNLPSKAYPGSEPGDQVSVVDLIKMMASGSREFLNAIRGFNAEVKRKGKCRVVDVQRSFIRLGAPGYTKYGGGLRVKKIEVSDNWKSMTDQRESVYGQHYIYKTTQKIDGQVQEISSGVASWEPMIGGEENPFHTPIDYAERLAPMAPVDYMYSEMPLGESFYPAASVGYSKVRVRTINAKAKSANGWQETEFYTAKEFPTIAEHTLLDDESKKRYNPKLRNFLRIDAVQHINISQGFKIELNDMHGRLKGQASYAENDADNPIAYSRHFYRVDNDRAAQQHLNNTVWVVDSLNGHVNKNGQIGKDIELMVDMREQLSKTVANNHSVNVDLAGGFLFPIPIPSLIRLPQREEVRFRSAATVKIIHRYGILDSVVVMDKGSVVNTKNLVYDAETGAVVLSRTNNEFNDPVYNFNYPAHWAFSGMGMAYKNIDAQFSDLKLIAGKLYYSATNLPFPVERFFESGDELQLSGEKREVVVGDCIALGTTPGAALPNKMWAINADKGKEGDKGIYFIDKDGLPLSGVVRYMRILRSGKRNLLDAGAGTIVAMANPVREVSTGRFKFVFDSLSKVINTSAITYNDLWKVENSLYQADSCYRKIDTVTIYPRLIKTGLLRRGIWRQSSEREVRPMQNIVEGNAHFTASVYQESGSGNKDYAFLTRGVIKFNLDSIPLHATVQTASLLLKGFQYKGSWDGATVRGRGVDLSSYTKSHYLREHHTDRGNNARIYPMYAPWNNSFNWNSYALPTVSVAVPGAGDNVCKDETVNVTSVIQALHANPLQNEGMMMKLDNEDRDYDHDEIRALSFCGVINSFGSEGGAACENCIAPQLSVTYTYYKDTCIKVCRSNINDTMVNPYRWGILGNWRADKSYTFYHDRVQTAAIIPGGDVVNPTGTDIRRDGLLKSFSPFWQFTDAVLLNNADTSKWVWNSAESLFNSKGAEVENYDPLGRYNAALSGYHQTLPVAVGQNTKYRSLLFDGFEDYGYKTKDCITCESPREFDFVKNQTGVSLTQTQNHTGRYSVQVNAGNESTLTVPIVTAAHDALKPQLSVQVDSTVYHYMKINGVSTGFNTSYIGRAKAVFDAAPCGKPVQGGYLQSQPIDYNWGTAPPDNMCSSVMYQKNWSGYILIPYSDYYRFRVNSGGAMSARVNNVTVAATVNPGRNTGERIYLSAGTLVPFTVQYVHSGGSAFAQFQWYRDGDQVLRTVPASHMYRENFQASDTAGSVVPVWQFVCSKVNKPVPENIIKPTFSPIQGQQLVINAWVKMDGEDCNTAPVLEGVVVASFSTGASTDLVKTGVRIEGWQRYEAIVTVPGAATQMQLKLKGVSGKTIYVDDIRVQPYHSNMSSYVYDPVTLRLMAELDPNNYASFYEYDDDGSLIRVKKETERGIMTIKETRSALLKEN